MSNIPFTKEFGYIKLADILGVGSPKLNEVMDRFEDIERVNSLTLKQWIESRILTPNELARINNVSSERIYSVIKYCKFNGIRIITPEDNEYPEKLRYIENPPIALYARGKRLDDSAPSIGIVGARKSTEFGQKAAYSLGAKLALAGFTIISGGAVGVDSMAHAGAMNAGGNTVMVLGCGLDSKYLMVQESLRKKAELHGTLLSEFEPKTPATRYTFPIRNRIISALSCGVAVIEAGRKSGALITATYAMEQGKEIFALPGNINAPQYGGTNDLLRDGATPLLKVEDITEVYLGRFPDKLKTDISLTPEIKRGYYEEARRMSQRTFGYNNPKIDIKKNDSPKSIENKEKEKLLSNSKNAVNTSEGLPFTDASAIPCSENAKKIYLSFTQNTEFSDILLERSGLENGAFITAVTELELFGYVKAVPVGRYERIK
ncbi:MAG: DNA-processing protein DprA [Clostridia bacterium]|nr:DNA-processing protein DprA [Clostridia bacterium]